MEKSNRSLKALVITRRLKVIFEHKRKIRYIFIQTLRYIRDKWKLTVNQSIDQATLQKGLDIQSLTSEGLHWLSFVHLQRQFTCKEETS